MRPQSAEHSDAKAVSAGTHNMGEGKPPSGLYPIPET